jgi:2-methylcitrate dehydratase PrpD
VTPAPLAVRCAELALTGIVPDAVRWAATRAVLDTVGVALAGANEPVTRAARELTPDGPARFWGSTRCGTALDAAFVNAVAAHVLDYDDVHADVMGHPSAGIVPAVVAAGELVGASGATVLDGYAVGLEIASVIGRALGPSHPARGFHSSSTTAVFGAASGSARVLGLDLTQTATALSIAASAASGLRANFATMTKALHLGAAARDGLHASLLARGGVTAAPTAVEEFLAAYSDDVAVPPIGPHWRILDPGLAVKKYACCNRGHRTADAVLALVTQHELAADDVARIEVEFPAGQVDADGRVGPMRYPVPTTGLEAKFSLPYVVAAAVLDRRLGIAQFSDAAVLRPAARALGARVVIRSDPHRHTGGPRDYVEVSLILRTGRALARRVYHRRGDPAGGPPLDDAEITAKYAECAATVFSPDQVAATSGLIWDLAGLADVRSLTAALAVRGGADE